MPARNSSNPARPSIAPGRRVRCGARRGVSAASAAAALAAVLAATPAPPAIAAGRLCLSTSTVSFGNRLVGSETTAGATVTNCGNASWSFTSVRADPATGAAYHPVTGCAKGSTLAPGDQCTVTVRFAPTTTGQTSGGLWFGTDATPTEALFAFYGRGIDARAGTATLSFAPVAADFADQLVYTKSAPLPVTLRNHGPAPVTPARFVLTGPSAYDFRRADQTCAIGTPIAAGDSCLLWLYFEPLAEGTRVANLVLDAPQLAALAVLQISGAGVTTLPPANYQGLWWNASEAGWGINFAHQGSTIVATWFTFDAQGRTWWLIAELHETGDGVYSGAVSTLTGPPFDSAPFPPEGSPGGAIETVVGAMTATFIDAGHATIAYTVQGTSQTKAIVPLEFGPRPVCTWGAVTDPALATNYQGLWWNPAEAGWGISLAHQGGTIFATWFTYDAQGRPWWLIAEMHRDAAGTWSGTVATVAGPPFDAAPFPPEGSAGGARETTVGTATLTFADGNHAALAYTVGGVAQVKAITRMVWAPPGTVCE
jgi:hypothetical protein